MKRNQKFGYLGLLMKFSKKREYSEELLGGILHCNRVPYFRGIDDSERGDEYEGLRIFNEPSILSRTQFSIRNIQEKEWHELEGIKSITISYRAIDDLALFCTSLIRSKKYDDPCQEMIDEFMHELKSSLPCFIKMGRYAVVIRDVPEFFLRVKQAIERNGYWMKGKSVNYFDTYPQDLLYRSPNSLDPIFHKRKDYQSQKEHRIAIGTNTHGTEPIKLDIGSIRDIAFLKETNTLLEELKFRVVPL